MTAWLSSLKVQLGGLIVLLVGAGLYSFSDGGFSVWTPDQQGHRWYQKGDHARAAQHFVDPMWQGVALYRAGELRAVSIPDEESEAAVAASDTSDDTDPETESN